MFYESFWGQNGFEELRRYIKQGNEFCKEVSAIMQERSELEVSYAKSLSKLSIKLNKLASTSLGSLASAWSLVASEMENDASIHRSVSTYLHDELYKPCKQFSETQHKRRKPIEAMVEKSLKTLLDRRSEELKLKKNAFSNSKEREKLSETIVSAKSGRGKPVSEKDLAKLEKKLRQYDESIRKSDRDYMDICLKSETARQDWDSAVFKGATQLQGVEEERISYMTDMLSKYNSCLSDVGPKLTQMSDRLGEAVISVDTGADLRTVIDQKGTGPNQPEQRLMDFYAEDHNNTLEKDRRRQCLQNYSIILQQDIEREVRTKEGVQKLVDVYNNRPSFADPEAQSDAKQKLANVNSFINFLEANHYKISKVLSGIDGRSPPESKFSQYIEQNRDKQGQVTSVLRLPFSMVRDCYLNSEASSVYRPPAEGGHDSHYDDDEFDSVDANSPLCCCTAIYDYDATQEDELTIHTGNVISVLDKQVDGWWLGELNGKTGLFPATYVEEQIN